MTTKTGSAFLAQLSVRSAATAAAAKRRPKKRKKKIRIRPLRQPDALRRKYRSAIVSEVLEPAIAATRKLMEEHGEALAREAAAQREDMRDSGDPGEALSREVARLDTASRASKLIRKMAEDFFEEFTLEKLRDLPARIARATSELHKSQMRAQFKVAISIDIPFTDKRLSGLVEDFTTENVALIRTIPARMFEDVESTMLRDLRKGLRWEEIAPHVEDRFGVSESRAALIARDQVGKFYGDLNQTRQEDLGVTSYVWRTARDNRVRVEHEDREGVTFKWTDPPEDGPPGEPINCRCQAEPDLEPLLAAMRGES